MHDRKTAHFGATAESQQNRRFERKTAGNSNASARRRKSRQSDAVLNGPDPDPDPEPVNITMAG